MTDPRIVRALRTVAGALAVTVAACAPPAGTDAGSDASAPVDGSADPDASAPMDASIPVDSAVADGSTSADASAPVDSAVADGNAPSTDGGPGIAIDALAGEIAASVCGALFRCCSGPTDLATYFAPYVGSSRLDALRMRFPPNVAAGSFTESVCRATLTEAFAITPWADWIAAARAGRVRYDGAQAQACRDTLRGAACGKPVWDALGDARCFGFTPGTGEDQRRFFARTQTTGTCSFLRDGVGGIFFGTCDPTQAFCCYDNGSGRCTVPPITMMPNVTGTCRRASAEGEACTTLPTAQVCRTGLECGGTNRCVAPRTAALASGANCWTIADGVLGTCSAGEFCNLFGSNRCEPLRADGMTCGGGAQCRSEFCVCPPSGCRASADGGAVEVGRCGSWGLCAAR